MSERETDSAPQEPDDATIVVPAPDETIVARSGEGTHDNVVAADSESAPVTARRPHVGDPVETTDEIPAELAKLFFKNPLDARRRAPEPTFPKDQSSLPRGGVRSSIPVVYGARPEQYGGSAGATEFSRWIGPPPIGYELAPADRTALPSTARFNRRFRLAALLGGAGVIVVTVSGLWFVATQLLQR